MSETAVKATHPVYIYPVYVDGPLKGQNFPVVDDWRQVQAIDYGAEPDLSALPPVVTYTLRKFGFRSGDKNVMLWLGVSGPGEPDAEVLADLLLSDAAKAARVS